MLNSLSNIKNIDKIFNDKKDLSYFKLKKQVFNILI